LLGFGWLGIKLGLLKVGHDLFKKLNRSINIEPQLLVGLAMDDFMEVQELGVVLLLGSQKGN